MLQKSPSVRSLNVFGQFSGYLISGSLATIAHYTTLILLVEYLSIMRPLMASTIGFLAGAITGFLLNSQFVFTTNTSGMPEFIKYLFMASCGLLVNFISMSLLLKIFNLYYLSAQILTTIFIVVINFSICKQWIFKSQTKC
jgi:putative flippase GtrA